MDKEPPQPAPEDPVEDNIVEFPINEYMRSRQRHPAGKLGRKSIQEILLEITETEKDKGDET